MKTKPWRWLARLFTHPDTLPAEFRPERVDELWRSEYLALWGHESPKLVKVPYWLRG
jgi:hypothetical protein